MNQIVPVTITCIGRCGKSETITPTAGIPAVPQGWGHWNIWTQDVDHGEVIRQILLIYCSHPCLLKWTQEAEQSGLISELLQQPDRIHADQPPIPTKRDILLKAAKAVCLQCATGSEVDMAGMHQMNVSVGMPAVYTVCPAARIHRLIDQS